MGKITDFFALLFGDEHWTDASVESFSGHVFSDLLPYRVYDPETALYYNEGTTGFLLEVPPITNLSEIEGSVHAALTTQCPSNGTVQFINYTSPDIANRLSDWAGRRAGRSDLIDRAAMHRVKHFDKMRFGSDGVVPCVPHERRVFVAAWVDGSAGLADQTALKELRRALAVAFGGMQLVKDVAPTEFINLLGDLVHCQPLEGGASHDYIPGVPLNYQLPGSGVRVDRKGLSLMGDPDLSCSLATVRKFPGEFTFGLGYLLNGAPDRAHDRAPGPMLTSLTLRSVQARDAGAMMLKKRAANEHVATTKFATFAHDLSGKRGEIDNLHAELEAGERLFESVFMVAAFARGNTDESFSALSDVAKIYRGAKFQLERDMFLQLPLFLSVLPFGVDLKRMGDFKRLTRMRLLKGKAASALMPVHGEWAGSNSMDAMLLVARQGQLFAWDPFKSEGNYNVAVTGKSGAGKSVFMQELVTGLYSTGARVVVIDDGYSFKSTASLLGGAWVGFDGSNTIGLNPFSMVDAAKMLEGGGDKGAEEYAAETIDMIARVVGTMAALGDQRAGRVEGIEEDLISAAVAQVWRERGTQGEIRHVRDLLANEAKTEPRLNDVVLKLARYCPEGPYGRYFEGPSNLTLEAAFSVFELSDIKAQKGLESVVLQIIMFLATELMFKTRRDERVVILIDEAWDLLSGPGTSKFIEGVVRRARKYTGGLITGTQSINDYLANPAAQVCFENSDWTVMLAQKPETIDGLQKEKRLGVSPFLLEQIKSLKSYPGEFAELAIKGPSGWFFGRLVLDPYSLAVYSSKGSTVETLRRYREDGMEMGEALELMVERGEVV